MSSESSQSRSTEYHNPYLRQIGENIHAFLSEAPGNEQGIDTTGLGYLGMGGKAHANPFAQSEALASIPVEEVIASSRNAMGSLPKAGRQAIEFALKDRRGMDKPTFWPAVDGLFLTVGWREPSDWPAPQGSEGEAVYDEADTELTLASALSVMTQVTGVLDTYAGLQIRRKSRDSHAKGRQFEMPNFHQADTHMMDKKAFELVRTLGPRAVRPVQYLASMGLQAVEVYEKLGRAPVTGEVDLVKWFTNEWAKNAMCLQMAGAFLDTLAETKRETDGLSTEELKEYSDELMSAAKAHQEYGVQDAVGMVENKNLPFREVHIASMDSVIAVVDNKTSFAGRESMALMTFTNGHFVDSATHRTDIGTKDKKGGVITLTQNVQLVQPPEKAMYVAVLLGSDGELYNTHGYPLRPEAEAVGGQYEYEVLRAEVVGKFFELTVPLNVDPADPSVANIERPDYPTAGDGATAAAEWSLLRVRRERPAVPTGSTESNAQAAAESGNAFLALHNIPWQFRRLPQGFRRTAEAERKYYETLRASSIDPLNARPIPEGYTFVKAYIYGSAENGTVKKRLKPRHRG